MPGGYIGSPFDAGHADGAVDLVVDRGRGRRRSAASRRRHRRGSACESPREEGASSARRRARCCHRHRQSSPGADRCRRRPAGSRLGLADIGVVAPPLLRQQFPILPTPGNSLLLNHRPCSRQSTVKPFRAISFATTAPEGPAPMISTSTVSAAAARFPFVMDYLFPVITCSLPPSGAGTVFRVGAMAEVTSKGYLDWPLKARRMANLLRSRLRAAQTVGDA